MAWKAATVHCVLYNPSRAAHSCAALQEYKYLAYKVILICLAAVKACEIHLKCFEVAPTRTCVTPVVAPVTPLLTLPAVCGAGSM